MLSAPPTAAQYAIGDMIMRDNRLYACANQEVWGLDTILVDSSFQMVSNDCPALWSTNYYQLSSGFLLVQSMLFTSCKKLLIHYFTVLKILTCFLSVV